MQKTLSKPGNGKHRDCNQTETKTNTESGRKCQQGAEKKLGSLDGNQGVSCFLYMDVCLGQSCPPASAVGEKWASPWPAGASGQRALLTG